MDANLNYKKLKYELIETLNSLKKPSALKQREEFKELDWFFKFDEELPENWLDINFMDVTWLITCGVAKKPIYVEAGIPFLSAQNARPFKANLDKIRFISESQFKTLTVGGKPERNDILYTRVGNCGEAAKITFDFDFAIYVSLTLIKPVHELINCDYLVAFLNSRYGLEQASAGAIGTGLQNLNVNNVRKYRIPLPPLPEQQRIVAKLDTLFGHLDALKTCLDRIPQLLKDFRQKVLTQAVTGKLTEEWREGNSQLNASDLLKNELNKRFEFWIENEKQEIELKGKKLSLAEIKKKYKEPIKPLNLSFQEPDSWVKCTWDQLSNWITYGFTRPMPHVDKGIPIITVTNVRGGNIEFDTAENTTKNAFDSLNPKDKPKFGDILITKDGATLGRSAIVRTDEKFCIGQSVAVVWLRSTISDKNFLQCVIESSYIQDRIWEVARGMGMPHLSITDFRALTIGLPPLEEQQEIVRRVESLFAKVDRIEASYQKLKAKIEQLPQALLVKAFRGELVKQLPTDGDARVLLEQIKQAKAGLEKGGKSKGLTADNEVRMVADEEARYCSR